MHQNIQKGVARMKKNITYSLMLLCILPMHAMDKEITYLFAGKDSSNYNDYYIRTYIEKSVFYHLAVHALQSQELDADAKSELLRKIRSNNIKLHGGYFSMTDKDAYHRLLRCVIVNGSVRTDQTCIGAISQIYPVLINGASSTLICKVSKLESSLLQEGDDGIVTSISSDQLCKPDNKIAKKFQELVDGE